MATTLKQTKTYAIRILGTNATPYGDEGFIIECTCAHHREGQTRVLVRENMRPSIEASSGLVHGYVQAVWGPLGAGLGRHRNGKWRVYADQTTEHATAYLRLVGLTVA